jgi:hypothetical protein
MPQYTITLSEAENLALSRAAYSQEDWINNAVHERCRIAMEEIVSICVEQCLKEGIQIPLSKDEMVILSFEKGWVVTAKEIHLV